MANYDFFTPIVVPEPRAVQWRTDECVELLPATPFALHCPDPAAAPWLAGHLEEAFGFHPSIVVAETPRQDCFGSLPAREGAYAVSASRAGGVALSARDLAGVRNGFRTLRQIAIPNRGGLTTTHFIAPAFEIADWPLLDFRGIHFCWFPEQGVEAIERQIRFAAYYKFNYVVLESWGVWRSETHPWFGWADGPMTPAAVQRLVSVAADQGVCLVPQLNAFGHASLSRVRTGNHAVLDFSPEYEPLFEPYSGWNWCLSNETARRTLRDLCLEMHGQFGSPPFFHIGCDEACPPTCPACRAADYSLLFSSLVDEIAADFAARGASVMLWHDMLIREGDPRWKGFYANGYANADATLERLPRTAVICDWFYGGPQAGYPTLKHFAGKGFRTLTCPSGHRDGIAAQGAFAVANGLFGLLDTTWAGYFGRTIPEATPVAAAAAWGAPPKVPTVLKQDFSAPCNWHWRQMGWDMKLSVRRATGFYSEQFPSTTCTP